MIRAVEGPLISAPSHWVLCFDRRASSRAMAWLSPGIYKHVRAWGYVPFLHVWIFFDPDWRGISLTIAADGAPAQSVMQAWLAAGDPHLIRMPRIGSAARMPPVFGWCVPAIKRLIGLRSSALRPSTLYRHCITSGGIAFEDHNGKCCKRPNSPGIAGSAGHGSPAGCGDSRAQCAPAAVPAPAA